MTANQAMRVKIGSKSSHFRRYRGEKRDSDGIGRIPIFRVGVTAESCGADIEVQIANTRW
jgi:hypothetical protein